MKRVLFLLALYSSLNGYSHVPPAIVPEANDASTTICDDDGVADGQKAFDLTTLIPQILGPLQSPTDYDVLFYSDPARTIAIPDPNSTLLAIVYAKVVEKADPANTADSTVTINVIAQPTPELTVPPICVDSQTGTVTNSYIVSGYSTIEYDFQWKDSTGLVVSTAANFSTDVPGNYTVEISAKSVTGCTSGIIPFTVIKSARPLEVTYDVSGWFTEKQTITVFAVPYINNTSNFRYSLDGKTPQTSNVFTNVPTGPHEVIVSDVHGCGSVGISVQIQLVYSPKSFTPNGDGINDRWNILGLENQKDAQVYIFDRHGKFISQVFTDGDGWDGTLNGYSMPATDYWFKITYTEYGVRKEYKSHFALIR